MTEAPSAVAGAQAAVFFDYDADGLLDLLVLTAKGPRLLRQSGGSCGPLLVGPGWAALSSCWG